MNKSNTILFLTLFCSFGVAICAADSVPVPVMLWKQLGDGEVSSRAIPALIVQGESDIQQLITEESKTFEQQVVVFVRKSLCTEDLALREGGVTCHPNLAEIENKKYVPAVRDPLAALRKLNKTELNAYVESTVEISKQIADQQFIYLELPTPFEYETEKAFNTRLDRIIGAVVEKLNDIHPLYVLTAEQCNPQHASLSRQRREAPASAAQRAPAAPQVPAQTLKNPNLLVYFTEIIVYKKGDNHTIEGATLSVTDVTPTSLKAELKGNQVTIAFDVNDYGSTWYVQSFTVNGAIGVPSKHLSAPLGFSYKCTPVVNITVADNEIVAVGIRGLQLQPKFDNVADSPLKRFGDVNDCTGFTSIGIWSGILVSFLLLSIMTLGLSWILDIRTMDRFDDPKGTRRTKLLMLSLLFILAIFCSFSQEKPLQSLPPTKLNKLYNHTHTISALSHMKN